MRRALVAAALPACLAGCSKHAGEGAAGAGTVRVDGSSTVFPISEAVAEEFRGQHGARVTIGVSGTGGGMTKFCAGELDVTGASRPMKATERELCAKAGVEHLELAVALDGIAVVVNPRNNWVDHLTVAELAALWAPAAQGRITTWNQVRPSFPARPVTLFGPGVDSGTFDYFTEVVVGTAQSARGDYTASEDDNTLVLGVATGEGALGFFGFAYYAENRERLKVVPIRDGDGPPVTPTEAAIADGSYRPLSRRLFLYVAEAAAARPEVDAFVRFYLTRASALAADVGFVGLPAGESREVLRRYDGGIAEPGR